MNSSGALDQAMAQDHGTVPFAFQEKKSWLFAN